MKRTFLKIVAIGIVGLPLAAMADPIPVTYDIGQYGTGGYSASWVHSASGCEGIGPDTGMTLYMCGAALSTNGTIEGSLDGGVLTITGGTLNIGGTDYDVQGGMLGSLVDEWRIQIENFGDFLFEGLVMGDGLPNFFDGSEMILWGQNLQAYICEPGNDSCSAVTGIDRWGIDLHGVARVQVPEPGTLALFGIGLLGLGLAKRRRV